MSSVAPKPDAPLAIVGPVADAMVTSLELAREALTRCPLQSWGEEEGPAIGQIVAQIDRTLALQGELRLALGDVRA